MAVVGGGAGGAAAALYLRKAAGLELDIELFERSHQAGGRVQSIDFAGEHSELGGAVYHLKNELFAGLVEEGKFQTFNPLHEHTNPSVRSPLPAEEPDLLGVWNGKLFVFQQSASWVWSIVEGFYRYGMDPVYVSIEAKRVLEAFLQVYPLLEDPGSSFGTVEALLEELGLLELTRVSLLEHLTSLGICKYNGGAYCHEVVVGLTRVNYGQSLELNALVGLIALVGSTDEVGSVVGGNSKVISYAIWRANALVHWNSPVTAIRQEESGYLLTVNGTEHGPFAKVIIACPLEFSNITMPVGMKPWAHNRPYQLVHVALIVGQLNLGGYFGQDSERLNQPQQIITTESSEPGFTSIFLHSSYDEKSRPRNLYKVFSRLPFEEEKLDQIFLSE